MSRLKREADKFTIGIQPPKDDAINGNGLDISKDTGHVFLKLTDDSGVILNQISFGPELDVRTNKLKFFTGLIDATMNYDINEINQINNTTYSWNIYGEQAKKCQTAFASKIGSPGAYSPSSNCASTAVDMAEQCGIYGMPRGVSPVNFNNMIKINMSNPYGLQQQLDAWVNNGNAK